MHRLRALIGCAHRRGGADPQAFPPARFLPSLLAGALAACAHVPPLPHAFASEHAEVHARSVEHAQAVAEWIDEVAPRIQEKLGLLREAPRVYVAPEILPEDLQGLCFRSHIVVDGRLSWLQKPIVLHELTHWYSEPLRSQLSQPLYEGLADAMVVEVDRENATGFLQFRLSGALACLATPGVAERTAAELETPSRRWPWGLPEITRWSEAVGYVLVSRIGTEGLSELCAESRRRGERSVPFARVLEAAGFERLDTREMRTLVEGMLREAEQHLVFTGLLPPP